MDNLVANIEKKEEKKEEADRGVYGKAEDKMKLVHKEMHVKFDEKRAENKEMHVKFDEKREENWHRAIHHAGMHYPRLQIEILNSDGLECG